MNITINTDASYCNSTKVGGYAFWITTNIGRYKKYGELKNTTNNSTEAELKAIANSLEYLKRLGFVDITKVYINTDSLGAITSINNSINNLNGQSVLCKYIVKTMYDIVRQSNLRLTRLGLKNIFNLRHVKAHNYTGSRRTYVNEWCDEHAKISMRNLRNNL